MGSYASIETGELTMMKRWVRS